MTTTVKTIVDKLTELGFSLTYTIKDRGGYDQFSVYDVTITRSGKSYTTEYSKGSGHRVWNKNTIGYSGYWSKYITPFKQVQIHNVSLTHPDKCQLEARERQLEVFDEFKRLTDPIPPTIDEVVYALVSESSCVRYGQTFEDFCDELGYDKDSRKAEKVYNGCRDTHSAMIRFGVNLDEMDSLFSDY